MHHGQVLTLRPIAWAQEPPNYQPLQPMKPFRALNMTLSAGACSLLVASASALDEVAGSLVTLTSSGTAPNGAWSWFGDERAIIDDSDPNNTLLLVSSISSAASGSPESGDVDLLWLNMDTGVQGEFELHHRFERDDHNSAALYIRPDGRYVASYTRHGTDDFMYWRVSTNPHDPTAWDPEQSMDASGTSTRNATYNNLSYLPNDNGGSGRLYDFTRAVNWNPTILTSYDQGDSWTQEGLLLSSAGSIRPYMRYFSDGNRIHFTATDGHPRDVNNSIYHGYVEDGQLFRSDGVVIDSNLFDSAAVTPQSLTTVFAANTVVGGIPMTRAWNIDVAIDSSGDPYCIFQARLDPGTLSGGQESLDHQFFYARYDSGLNSWAVHPLAAAGRDIYAASPNGSEDDYTGLAALDPTDPDTVFISTDIDPGSGVPLDRYEIFRGRTTDGGATWAWDPITANSSVDNIRPIVPQWASSDTALVWMRGAYSTYTSWTTEVVAITEITGLVTVPGTAQVTYVDADTSNQSGTTNTTFADGSAFAPPITGSTVPADNQWWERTGFANGGDILAVNGGSNAPVIRTTISGLTPGASYDVYVYYWWADPFGNGEWDLGAGLTQAGITYFSALDGSPISNPFANGPILIQEGNRDMYQYHVGATIAAAAGTIDVYVDDNPGNDDRSWYDGVGTSPISLGGIGANYCVAASNSSGSPGVMAATGSDLAAANNVTLRASSLPPNQFGIFVTSRTQGFVPGAGGTSNGNICLGGAIGRFTLGSQIVSSGATGEFTLPIDLTMIPQGSGFVTMMAGDTWNYQAWHRDQVGLGSNFTDGLRIVFN